MALVADSSGAFQEKFIYREAIDATYIYAGRRFDTKARTYST